MILSFRQSIRRAAVQKAAAMKHCARAEDLVVAARATRAAIGAQVRGNSLRRVARLACGASEAELLESRQRRCPYCRSEAVTLGGAVRASGAFVKSEFRCENCSRIFVFVRRVVGIDSASPGRARGESTR